MNWKIVFIAVAIAVLGGCHSAPIYNVVDAPVVVATGNQATMERVKAAILRAGGAQAWQMAETAPGVINARMTSNTHTALVDIRYDTKAFSIMYRDSTNLKAGDGHIHKAYNGWVESLDRAIRAELLRI